MQLLSKLQQVTSQLVGGDSIKAVITKAVALQHNELHRWWSMSPPCQIRISLTMNSALWNFPDERPYSLNNVLIDSDLQ